MFSDCLNRLSCTVVLEQMSDICVSHTLLLLPSFSTEITRMWPMPNVMVALPNIGGALCSTPQSLADTHY